MRATRICLSIIFAVCAWGRSQAQHQSDPVTVPVDVVANYVTAAGTSQYNPASIWVSVTNISVSGLQYPYMSGSAENRVDLKPGMAYYFYVSVAQMQSYSLRVHPPDGYSAFIDDIERNRINTSGTRTIKVRIEASAPLPAGFAPEPRPGRILWSVGLGVLKNGDPAGSIQMRESSITANCFKPDALYYDSDNPDVRIFKSGAVLRQVFANECLADIQALSSASYIIRFFARTQVGAQNPDGSWSVPIGNEFVSYLVENPVHPTLDRIKITRTDKVGGTRVSWAQLRKSGSTWTAFPWNTGTYPATPDSQSTITYSNSEKNELVSTKDVGGTTVAQTLVEYKDFAWGRELWRTTVGHGDTNPLVSTLDYHTTSSAKGNYRQVKSRIGPDGSWECYEYYDDIDRRGQLKRSYRPFGDSPASPPASATSECVVTDIDYAADFTGQRTLPSSILTSRGGVTLARTNIAYDNTSETRNGLPIVIATRDDYSSSSLSQRTITRSYRADTIAYTGVYNAAFYAGKPHSVIRPDNTMQAYVYQWGVFNPSSRSFTPVSGGTEFLVTIIEGTTSAAGNTACAQWSGYAIDGGSAPAFYLIPGKSTASATIYAASGLPVYTYEMIYTASGWQGVSGRLTAYVMGLAAYPSWTVADGGYGYSPNLEVFSADYNDGNLLSWSKDAAGIERYYMHDSLGRRYGELISRVAGQPVVTPSPNDETWKLQRFDAASRVVQSWTADAFNYPNPASTDLLSTAAYDWAGRVTSQTTRGVVGETVSTYTTTYTHFYGGDPRTTRVVGPDGADIITTNYLDGRPKSVTGSGTAPQYFSYGISGDGRLVTEKKLSAGGDGWTQTYSDWLGRDSEVLRSTYSGGHTKYRSVYNSLGQITETQLFNQGWQALLAPTRYRYDANGRLDRCGLDVDQDGSLGDTGLDRVTLRGSTFVQFDGAWWAESTSTTLTDMNSASAGVKSTTRTRLTGLFTTQSDGSVLIGETRGYPKT